MGSNLGHGAFIAPTKDDVTLCWKVVRELELNDQTTRAGALSRVLQAYERIGYLFPQEEK